MRTKEQIAFRISPRVTRRLLCLSKHAMLTYSQIIKVDA